MFVLIICLGCKPAQIDKDELKLPSVKTVSKQHNAPQSDREIIMARFAAVITRSKEESTLTWKPPAPTTEAEVNRRINKIPYSDKDVHGNHWKTPQEIMKQGYTDCVGYATTKYIALRDMGYDANRLKMMVVYVPHEGYHAMLVVDDNRVMNNLVKTIKPLAYYDHKYKKLYWVNETDFGDMTHPLVASR